MNADVELGIEGENIHVLGNGVGGRVPIVLLCSHRGRAVYQCCSSRCSWTFAVCRWRDRTGAVQFTAPNWAVLRRLRCAGRRQKIQPY